MAVGTLGLSALAGVLSTLSPCVLPILPIVFAAAAAAHRFGVAALSAGLVVSFVAIGLFVATAGFAAGLDGSLFRAVGAVALGVMGVVLLSGMLQQRLAMAVGGAGSGLLSRLPGQGLGGPLLLGLVLGAVWSPCVGPTLGAASLLAAQGRDLGAVALSMAAFGLGAAVPLLLVGALSREAMRRWRGRLTQGSRAGKLALGGFCVGIAALVLTGGDKALESLLVAASPAWLTDLTTRF